MKLFRRKKCEQKPTDMPDHIISLDFNNFEDFICKYPLSVIDFYADWCKPCKDMAPRVRRLSKIYKDKVAFGKINIDENREIASSYDVMSVPQLLMFSYGRKMGEIIGLRSVGEIKRVIDNLLKRVK